MQVLHNARWDSKWKGARFLQSTSSAADLMKKLLPNHALRQHATDKMLERATDNFEEGGFESPQPTPPDSPARAASKKNLASRSMNERLAGYGGDRQLELIIKLQRMVRRDILRKRLMSLIYGATSTLPYPSTTNQMQNSYTPSALIGRV